MSQFLHSPHGKIATATQSDGSGTAKSFPEKPKQRTVGGGQLWLTTYRSPRDQKLPPPDTWTLFSSLSGAAVYFHLTIMSAAAAFEKQEKVSVKG